MKSIAILVAVAALLGGCSTGTTIQRGDIRSESTNSLCQAWLNSSDQQYRLEVAEVLRKRGASDDKCRRLVQTDNSIATGIAIAGLGVAAGAAASNGGGGYYPNAYGVAWDQFYDQYYQLTWRCRDRATGRFVDDYRCNGKPMVDSTWPGWTA